MSRKAKYSPPAIRNIASPEASDHLPGLLEPAQDTFGVIGAGEDQRAAPGKQGDQVDEPGQLDVVQRECAALPEGQARPEPGGEHQGHGDEDQIGEQELDAERRDRLRPMGTPAVSLARRRWPGWAHRRRAERLHVRGDRCGSIRAAQPPATPPGSASGPTTAPQPGGRTAGTAGSGATGGEARSPGGTSHSSPLRCIQRGAWGFRPERKSKAAPTPIITGASIRPRCAAIQRSCLGVLSPTQTMSGRALLISSTTARSSSSVRSRKGGVCVPTICSPGKRARSFSASASATPSAPPYRKWRYPATSGPPGRSPASSRARRLWRRSGSREA